MSMDSSTARSHPQEMGSQTLESMLIPTKAEVEKKTKASDQQALKCPRCDSTNTKFCYYNNYSLSQPRYFCKSCRRYWTKGGTLRNVPVGGGCRKTKRSSSKKAHDQPIITRIPSPIPCSNYNSPLSYDSSVFPSGSQLPFDAFSMPRNPNMPAGGFLETPLGFQSLYYGVGDGGVDLGLAMNGGMGMGMGMGMGIGGLNHEMGLMGFEEMSGPTPTSTSVATVKQENCSDFGKGDHGEISRGLWGFAWQNGDGNIGSWNGIGSSNWHGLLNTPLM